MKPDDKASQGLTTTTTDNRLPIWVYYSQRRWAPIQRVLADHLKTIGKLTTLQHQTPETCLLRHQLQTTCWSSTRGGLWNDIKVVRPSWTMLPQPLRAEQKTQYVLAHETFQLALSKCNSTCRLSIKGVANKLCLHMYSFNAREVSPRLLGPI